MGAVAQGIESNVRVGLRPKRFEIIDESHKHAGHAGARAGGESHFRIVVVADAFEGKTRIQRQQMIYGLLKPQFDQGLHALAMTTLTPAEDAARTP